MKKTALCLFALMWAGVAWGTNWPNTISSDSNLFVAVNNCNTTLSASASSAVTTINVNATTCFPSVGYVTIGSEAIYYTGKTATSFTGCVRGSDGTSAGNHFIGDTAKHSVIAAHHNALKDEVVGMSTYFLQGTDIRIDTTTTPGSLKLGGNLMVHGPSPWIDPRAYPFNAKCDDSTDDHVAVQAAITYAQSLVTSPPYSDVGPTIIVPGCKFYLGSSGLTVSKSAIHFSGVGRDGSGFRSDVNGPIFTIDTTAGDIYFVNFKDLSIHSSVGASSTNVVGIAFSGPNSVRRSEIQNVHFTGTYTAIRSSTTAVSDWIHVNGNLFDNADLNTIHYAIYKYSGGTGWTVNDNQFILDTNGYGIYAPNSLGDFVAHGNHSEGGISWMYAHNPSSTYSDGVTVSGNKIDSVTQPIDLLNMNRGYYAGNKYIGGVAHPVNDVGGSNNTYDDDNLGVSLVQGGSVTARGTFIAGTPILVASGGTGASSYTAGSVVYSNGTTLTQDNSHLFWDGPNHRLGINNPSPGAPLDLTGPGTLGSIVQYWGVFSGVTAAIRANPSDALPDIGSYTNHGFGLMANNARWAFLTTDGKFGLGTSSPSAQFHSTGTVRMANFGAGAATFDASGNVSSVSDERLKNIQGQFSYGLKELLQVRPISYRWNKKSGMEMAHTYHGFSAQNLKNAMPDIVFEGRNGYYSFEDRGVAAALVNAIKELSSKLESLQTRLSSLEKK